MRSVFTSTLFSVLMLALTPALAAPQHALTVYGEAPKYAAGFDHFDYTNPNAPKGGSLRRSAMEIGQFDHLVPYLDKGIGVSDIDGLVYSPLAVRSLDEPYTVYGLIAQGIERAPDGLWLRFYLTRGPSSPTARRSPPKTCASPSTCSSPRAACATAASSPM